MPTLVQLEYVLAVYETGHFGQAAAKVGISQPTLSAQIQKAESTLGLTIFDRRARPVVTTELGTSVVEQARVVVDAHKNLVRLAAGRFSEPAGPFALGIIPTLAPFVLPWFLQHFASRFPAVELSIYERPTDDLITDMEHRRLDAAILATPLGESSLSEHVLFYDPFYVYAHRGDALLSEDRIEADGLDPEKLWLLEDGHCFRMQVLNYCGVAERVHLGSVRFAGGSFETIKNLIDASEGYTLIPETYARTLPRATRLRSVRAFDSHTPTREVSLVHHHNMYKSDVAQALVAAIASNIPPVFERTPCDQHVVPIREVESD